MTGLAAPPRSPQVSLPAPGFRSGARSHSVVGSVGTPHVDAVAEVPLSHPALPDLGRLFPGVDGDRHSSDPARSVYSPAAYLADLLQLVDDHFQEDALTANRPAIREIPLDATNTDTEVTYLDVVIEVLGAPLRGQLDTDPDETLRTAPYPFALPFSRDDVRRRLCLRQA